MAVAIGATHDLKLFGADTLDIMQQGRWESHTNPSGSMTTYLGSLSLLSVS